MKHIRDNAELAVRNLLRTVAARQSSPQAVLHAIQWMDDGTPIGRPECNKNHDSSDADLCLCRAHRFDRFRERNRRLRLRGCERLSFSPSKRSLTQRSPLGTGPEMWGSLNAPISVCYSAVIYCLRAMVDSDIPLNAGCLAPITLKIPPNSLLDPSETCAVVGGNVVTSQRITDVVLLAFSAVAASQGDCNNFTFGSGGTDQDGNMKEGYGYYETIAGEWRNGLRSVARR